jgi:outer membrane receptor protein involved in Fe transport
MCRLLRQPRVLDTRHAQVYRVGGPSQPALPAGNGRSRAVAPPRCLGRYDSYIESSTVASADQRFSAKWITDLDVGYGITDNLSLAIGAYNLFNKYPDKVGLKNNEGSGAYGSFAPFGLSGGFYYARLALNL